MSDRQWASENEAGKQRNPSTEAQEPIRSRTGLSLEGMASNPSRVVGKCLRRAALNGVYPMEPTLSTIKSAHAEVGPSMVMWGECEYL